MARTTRPPRSFAAQAGMTIIEILVGMSVMVIAAGAIAFLVGAAVQAKMITAVRAADTESVRETLGRIAERLRNAGLNIDPATWSGTVPRCADRVVAAASEPSLQPTASRIYVSGDILIPINGAPGGPYMATIGYQLGADPVTGSQIVMEYYQTCVGATNIAANSTPLSNPRVPVTSLAFTYYAVDGSQVTLLSTPSEIQKIWAVKISMTVTASQGRSGTQTATLSRYVVFRDPDPQKNLHWVDPNESF